MAELTDATQERILVLHFGQCHWVERGVGGHLGAGVITQEPDDDGDDEDHAADLAHVLLGFVPHVFQRSADGGHAVGRELHHEGRLVGFEDAAAQEHCGEGGHEDTEGVERDEHRASGGGEEGADEQNVDR